MGFVFQQYHLPLYQGEQKEQQEIIGKLSALSMYEQSSTVKDLEGHLGFKHLQASFRRKSLLKISEDDILSSSRSKGCTPSSPDSHFYEVQSSPVNSGENMNCTAHYSASILQESVDIRLGLEACTTGGYSTSSLSMSEDSSSGLTSADPSGDQDAESVLKLPSGIIGRSSSCSSQRSLSSHFHGKSKSFTSFAEVVNVKSIQDLAKPERSFNRRRKSGFSNRAHLRSIEKSIQKKSHIRPGTSLKATVHNEKISQYIL